MFKSATTAISHVAPCVSRVTSSGATAIEYALIASGISIVIVANGRDPGHNVKGFYSNVATALK